MRRTYHRLSVSLREIRSSTLVGGAVAALLADQAGVVVGVLVVIVVAMTTLRGELRPTGAVPAVIGLVVVYEMFAHNGVNRLTGVLAVPLWMSGQWATRKLVERLRRSFQREWNGGDQGGAWVTTDR